jgi:hypothetical protein
MISSTCSDFLHSGCLCGSILCNGYDLQDFLLLVSLLGRENVVLIIVGVVVVLRYMKN